MVAFLKSKSEQKKIEIKPAVTSIYFLSSNVDCVRWKLLEDTTLSERTGDQMI